MWRDYIEFLTTMFVIVIAMIIVLIAICFALLPIILCMFFWVKYWWIGLILTIFVTIPMAYIVIDKYFD